MTFVDARLAAQPYIAGETFSAADVLYAGTFALFMGSPLLGDKKTKALEDYVARCVSRPAPHAPRLKTRYRFELARGANPFPNASVNPVRGELTGISNIRDFDPPPTGARRWRIARWARRSVRSALT